MGEFGFAVHPLDLTDVVRKYRIAEKLSERVVAQALRRRPPFVLGEITGVRSLTGDEATGWLIAVPLLPQQFLELPEKVVIRKLARATRVAAKEGARILGLGAFTAIPGGGGRRLADIAEIPVTTGNTYTVAIAIDGLLEGCRLMDIDPTASTLAIFGATGSIGRTTSHILARRFSRTVLVGRDADRLAEVARDIAERTNGTMIEVSTDVTALGEADAVMTVSSAVDAPVRPEHLRPGSVVCDVARPRDVSRAVARVRPDVLVIDGGVVRVPGELAFHWDFGLPSGIALACMAETMILALEQRYESYTIGKDIQVSAVEEMWALAAKHGFSLGGLRSFEQAVSAETIERVRLAAQERTVAR